MPVTADKKLIDQHAASAPRLIPIDDIFDDPDTNDRTVVDTKSIASLAADVQLRGIVTPLAVRPHDAHDDKFLLIAGHRRLLAAKAAGLSQVPALVFDVDDEQAAAIRLAENVHRLQLNPVEEAFAVYRLAETFTGTREEKVTAVAARMGMSQTWVRDKLYLAQLTKKVLPLVASGRLPQTHAREIAKVADPRYQEQLADEYAGDAEGDKSPGNLEQLKDDVKKVFRSLSQVPWDKARPVPGVKAPACVSCPSNTANDKLLFEHAPEPTKGEREIQNDSGNLITADGGPYCLNRGCYDAKRKAAENIMDAQEKVAAKAAKAGDIPCSGARLEKANLTPAGVNIDVFARRVRHLVAPAAPKATPTTGGGGGGSKAMDYNTKWKLEEQARKHASKVVETWFAAIGPQLAKHFDSPLNRLAWMVFSATEAFGSIEAGYGAKTGKTVSARAAGLMKRALYPSTLQDLLALYEDVRKGSYVEPCPNDFTPKGLAESLDQLSDSGLAHLLTALEIKAEPRPNEKAIEKAKLAELMKPPAPKPAAKAAPAKAGKAKKKGGKA